MWCLQVVDDILDYVSSSEDLGKPGAGADLSAGLYTAPLLLAARYCSSLKRLLDFGEVVGSKEEVVRKGSYNQSRFEDAVSQKCLDVW